LRRPGRENKKEAAFEERRRGTNEGEALVAGREIGGGGIWSEQKTHHQTLKRARGDDPRSRPKKKGKWGGKGKHAKKNEESRKSRVHERIRSQGGELSRGKAVSSAQGLSARIKKKGDSLFVKTYTQKMLPKITGERGCARPKRQGETKTRQQASPGHCAAKNSKAARSKKRKKNRSQM